MHIYDYVIIGSGLTGLTIANRLYKETQNLLVLEAQDFVGGDNRPVLLDGQKVTNGFRYLPNSDAAKSSLEFFSQLIGEGINFEAKESLIETYEASGFKKFVGFGEKPPEFYEQLSYFLSGSETQVSMPIEDWTAHLATPLQEVIHKKSIVTRFGFEGLDSEKPKLTHVVINGTKQIYAQNFIFAGTVKDLRLLIPDDVLNARAKAKLKKSTAWQAICLDLVHKVKIEKDNLFLLNGTTDDDIGPCIGRFYQNPASENQISQWMSFIDSESAEDTENIGLVLKKIKRQVRRAFPEVSDSIVRERIFISSPLSGADLKLNSDCTLPKVPNLWIASPQVNRFVNLLGSIMQARIILSSLGFLPAEKEVVQALPELPTEEL